MYQAAIQVLSRRLSIVFVTVRDLLVFLKFIFIGLFRTGNMRVPAASCHAGIREHIAFADSLMATVVQQPR